MAEHDHAVRRHKVASVVEPLAGVARDASTLSTRAAIQAAYKAIAQKIECIPPQSRSTAH